MSSTMPLLLLIIFVMRATASCDFEKLAGCPLPNTAEPDFTSLCRAYEEYRECVKDNDCMSETAPTSVLTRVEARNCFGDDGVPIGETPKISVDNGGVRVAVAPDKPICFQIGEDKTCLDDLVTNDGLETSFKAPLSLMQSSLASTASDLAKNMSYLASNMQSSLLSSQEAFDAQLSAVVSQSVDSQQALLAKVVELEDQLEFAETAILETALPNSEFRVKLCGKPCVPGQKISVKCDPEKLQQTQCSQCPTGTFSSEFLSEECTNCSVCESGIKLSKCNRTHDVVCGECQKACDRNSFLTQTCDLSRNRPSICTRCTVCKGTEVEVKPCTETEDAVCYTPMPKYGGNWMPFNWWRGKTGATWPKDEYSVFGHEFGTCKQSDPYCFARLPENLDEFQAQLLVMDKEDGSGNVYRWNFDPSNPVSHATFAAMRDHQIIPWNAVKDQRSWNPTVLNGRVGTTYTADSVMFRPQRGVWSFILDDDNCYCHTKLELGHYLCGRSDNGKGKFGFEMYDDQCSETSTLSNSIFMYYRIIRTNSINGAGVGWNMFWNFVPGQAKERDMLDLKYGDCRLSKTDGKGVKYTPANCMQKMPTDMDISFTEMLAIDWSNNVYYWKFNNNVPTSRVMFNSLTRGITGRFAHQGSFNPVTLRGSSPRAAQDSWTYRDACGTKSFSLDDDNCYCYTSIEVGSRLCGSGCTTNYGVDRLYDSYCNYVSNSAGRAGRGLTMYFRNPNYQL